MPFKSVLRWILLGLWTIFIVPIAQAPATKLAESLGLDQYYARSWEPAMSVLSAFGQNPWVIFLAGVFTGGLVFLWADYFFRNGGQAPFAAGALRERASLRLIMRDHALDPEEAPGKVNVWRWNVQRIQVQEQLPKVGRKPAPPPTMKHLMTIIFVVFDGPMDTSYRRVSSPTKPSMIFEVTELTNRSMIVVTRDEPRGEVIDIQVSNKPI